MPILLYIVVKNKIQPRILIFFDEGRPREDPDPFLTEIGSQRKKRQQQSCKISQSSQSSMKSMRLCIMMQIQIFDSISDIKIKLTNFSLLSQGATKWVMD